MAEIITIDELKLHIVENELLQIAGIGSFNTADGRALDLPKIEQAIKYASDIITGHLRKRYAIIDTLAVGDQPDMLKGIATDIIRYRLRSRSGDKNQVSEEVRDRYNQAMSYLGKASRGLVDVLFIADNDQPDERGGAQQQVHFSHDTVRSNDVMRGYHD